MAPGVCPHMTFRFHLKMRLFFAASRFSFNLLILERACNTQNKSEMSALSRHSSWNLADSSKQIISWRLQSALRSCRVSWWRKFTALPTLSPFFLWFHSWKIEEYQVNIAKITQITEFPTRGIFFLPMHPLCWSVTERGMKQMTNGQPWRRGAISKNKNLLNSWKVQKE